MSLAGNSIARESSFLNLRFLSLNACYFSLCCSLASFFGLELHLDSLMLDDRWDGLLMGALGLGSLLARPLFAHRLSSLRNCLRCLAIASAALFLSLAGYMLANSVPSMLAVRLLNGFGFAGVFCAVVALSPYAFHAKCGGRAFSFISISCLLPFLILPPFLDKLQALTGSFGRMSMLLGVPLLVSAPLALAAFRNCGMADVGLNSTQPSLKLRLSCLARPWMLLALFATLSFYYAYAWVFYNSDQLCRGGGVANPGTLMSVATLCAIGFRLLAGRLLDGPWRRMLLVFSLLLNASATFALGLHGLSGTMYFAIFAAFGLSWGAAVPLLSSFVMERSKREEQGFNLNMAAQMQDLGYFLGPLLGGLLQSNGLLPLFGCLAIALLLRRRWQ
jgi:MFS family permease